MVSSEFQMLAIASSQSAIRQSCCLAREREMPKHLREAVFRRVTEAQQVHRRCRRPSAFRSNLEPYATSLQEPAG